MRIRAGAVGATLLAVAIVATACGSGGSSKSKAVTASTAGAPTTQATTSLTIGSANFAESVVLANIYAGALRKVGVNVTVKANLGAREIIEPALESGQIDMIPEYVGNYLAFLDPTVTGGLTLDQTVAKLKTLAAAKGLTVTDPSPATDADAIAVTQATATKSNLAKISDLSPVAGQMVFGGPPECATRITCLLGLQQIYGLHFKSFKALDAGGPLTKSALANGDIQVARLFSSDEAIQIKHFTILDDDKHFQLAGNIIPVVRTPKGTANVTDVLNKVSAALTTDELQTLNKAVDIDHTDPVDAAKQFLTQKGLG
jgi:osmoprotectant transport system substrate-binding protein